MSFSWTSLVAEDGNVAGAGAIRLLELALERAPAEFEPRGVTGAAGVRGQPEGGRAQRRVCVGHVEVHRRLGPAAGSGAASRIRSMPAAHPMPGVGVPPSCSISRS